MGLAGKIRRIWDRASLSSVSHDSPLNRSSIRKRRAAFTGGTAFFARLVQAGVSLITIPLTIHYLGTEQFGLWVTISSMLAMATFADFGIGNGVLNLVAYADGKNDHEAIRRAISSGFSVLGLVGIVLFAVFAGTANLLSWPDFLHVTSARARAETTTTIIVFAACFTLNIPLDLVQRAQLGLQEGFRTHLWQLAGSLVSLAGVLAGIHLKASLPLLVAVLAGAPVLAVALNTIHFFGLSRPDLRPRLALVTKAGVRQIMGYGTLFFVLQLAVAVSFSADNVIIARVLGVARVPEYSIPQRMFGVIAMVVGMLVTPLWPAYAEAISRGDVGWVRRTLVRSLVFVSSFSAAGAAVLLLASRMILRWWIGPDFHASFALLAGLAIWSVFECCGNANAMFMNGANIVRFQIVIAIVCGVSCLAAKIYLTERFGIAAIPWATLLTYIPVVVIPTAFYVPRALRHLHQSEPRVQIATATE
ncbi:oligosaccharide flippase family protein [Occallatibacter savannae]|uniref:oligosaccharide flippase family protein n=1 Tax=Occallatibacter savannae TaxID=1002691 RepID=UPI0013A58EBB|nr:oligosaccharide flippase family protein [Occallatibacter savannae]